MVASSAVREERQEAVPRGFKQTEIGLIPEDWEVAALGEVLAGYRLGGNYPNTETAAGPPLIKMGNLGRGDIVLDKIECIPSSVRLDGRDRLRFGDVLFNTRNTLDLVGKIAMWRGELPLAYYNSNIMRFHFDPKRVSSSAFMNYALNSSDAIEFLRGIAIGTTSVAAIYWRDLRNLKFPVPPLAEQEAIAGALSDADGAIRAVERALVKQRAVKQAALHALLTPTTRLPGFSGKWETKTLGQLSHGKKEFFVDGDWIEAEHIRSAGIRFIQTGNVGVGLFVEKEDKKFIDSHSFENLNCRSVRPGDLLICRLAEPAGRACVVPDLGEIDMVTSVDVAIFCPPEETVSRKFLAQYFTRSHWLDEVRLKSGGTTHKRISRSALATIEISLPPLAEQRAIAAVLSDMDAAIAALEARREKLKAVKQGMMQALLTGKVRLV